MRIGLQATIVESLARTGVETYTLDPDLSGGPGILIFDKITQQLCDFVQEISRNGLDRILAMAVSRLRWRMGTPGFCSSPAPLTYSHGTHTPSSRRRGGTVHPLGGRGSLGRLSRRGAGSGWRSRVWKSALRQVVEVARFTDTPMLIMGETGTGKELVARLIHELDARPNKGDFVVLDCTTIVPEFLGASFSDTSVVRLLGPSPPAMAPLPWQMAVPCF